MKIRNPFNWNLRFGTIPSEFSEAMTYEEQVMWLYYQIKELKEGSSNYNYNLLENKPSIDGVILQGNITKTQLGIEQNYNILANKPQINGLTLQGNKSLNDLGIQGKLIAGAGIVISGNTISATGGGGSTSSYLNLTDKPAINDVVLFGNQRAFELDLQDSLQIDYTDEIQRFKYYDMTNIQIGDTLPTPIELTNNTNFQAIIVKKEKGMHFEIHGNYELLITNENYEVTTIFSTEGEEDGYIDITGNEGVLIINFVDGSHARLILTYTAEYIKNLAKYNKKLTQNIVLGTSILNLETGFYNTDKFKLYLAEAIDEEIISGNYETFYFDNDSQTLITSFEHFKFNASLNQWTYFYNHYISDGVLSDNHYMIPTSHAVYQAIQNISPSGNLFYSDINNDIVLKSDGTLEDENGNALTLNTGFYHLNKNNIITDGTFVYGSFSNALFYYEKVNNSHSYFINFLYTYGYDSYSMTQKDIAFEKLEYKNSTWNHVTRKIADEINSSSQADDVPSIQAVRNYTKSGYGAFGFDYGVQSISVGQWTGGATKLNLTTTAFNSSNDDFELLSTGNLKVKRDMKVNIVALASPYDISTPSSSNTISLITKLVRNGTTSALLSLYTAQAGSGLALFNMGIVELQENDELFLAIGSSISGQSLKPGTMAQALQITEIK